MVALGLGHPAEAAPARIRFNLQPKPYAEALLDLAQQANITLIGAGACEGQSRQSLLGSLTVEEALEQLLAEAPCGWRMVAPAAVEIRAVGRDVSKPTPPPPVAVAEVLVTATKRARNPRQLAVGITTVSGQDLQATGAADVDEAAGQLGGVLATNLGPGRDKLLLRGLSDGAFTGRARSTVATYLDDIPINYNAPDPDLRLVDVERVEVARGPQGALYGAGSMGGVYRIVSNKPDLQRFSAGGRTTGAITEGGAPSKAAEAYVNVPLWGVAGLRLSGYGEVQGGYLDDVNLQRKDVDRTERWGGRFILSVQPSDRWAILLTAAGQHLGSDDTHYTTPGMGLTRANRIAEPHANDIVMATATIRGSWGWGELTSSTGYVRHDYGSFYDGTAVQGLYTSLAQTSAYSERTNTTMAVQDIFLTSRGGGPFEWLAGLYGSVTEEHSPSNFLAQNNFAPDVSVYRDDRRDSIREFAAYGEASYAFASDWTLAVGGRAFSYRAHTRSHVDSERSPPRSLDWMANASGFSPKVSLQREFRSGTLAYAVYSEGYRGGGINSGGATPLTTVRETYAPDHLRNLEAGLKLQSLDKRLSVNSSLFYDVWENVQTDQFRSRGIPYTTNVGDAQIVGVETEVAMRWANGLAAQVNGRLSQIRTTHANPDFATQLVNGLPGAPAISGSALVSYERELFGDWRLKLVGETSYVGRSRVTFDMSYPPMGGYALARLSAEISGKGAGLQVFVSNPFNDFNDTFAFGNPFNRDQTRQITPQRPRTVGVTLFAAY